MGSHPLQHVRKVTLKFSVSNLSNMYLNCMFWLYWYWSLTEAVSVSEPEAKVHNSSNTETGCTAFGLEDTWCKQGGRKRCFGNTGNFSLPEENTLGKNKPIPLGIAQCGSMDSYKEVFMKSAGSCIKGMPHFTNSEVFMELFIKHLPPPPLLFILNIWQASFYIVVGSKSYIS